MCLAISISERELYEYHHGELVRVISVAVGQPDDPTPAGEYRIFQIDWNPDWTPPDSPWAAGAQYTPPGHPDNPMGRARLMFDPPYTIHGTDVYESLGRAASHGSVRMGNEDVIALARRVMEAGGAARPEEFYRQVVGDPGTMVSVEIPEPVPLLIPD
jgi:lipoprotein-anchoring transpeptidase ErfK/SrfK